MKKIIEVLLKGGIISPQELSTLVERVEEEIRTDPNWGRYIYIISGRLPLWAAAAISHALHPTRGVAIFDPRLGGGVVTQSHDPDLRVGDIIGTSFEVPIIRVEI